jgi:hypothetical protein
MRKRHNRTMFHVLNMSSRLGIPEPQVSGQTSTNERKPSMNEPYRDVNRCGAWRDSDRALLCTTLQGINVKSIGPVTDYDSPKCGNTTPFAGTMFQ